MGRTENSEDSEAVTELMDNIRDAVADCQVSGNGQTGSAIQSMVQSTLKANAPDELPPPAPRACFGRDELIKEIVGLAENLEPIAPVGAGGLARYLSRRLFSMTIASSNNLARTVASSGAINSWQPSRISSVSSPGSWARALKTLTT